MPQSYASTRSQAEEFFIENHRDILQIPKPGLIDLRIAAQGYDFGLEFDPQIAIEVKGMRAAKGQLLFTDREWTVATARKTEYWLVVIGDLDRTPRHNLIPDPTAILPATCSMQTSISAAWRSSYVLT